MLTRLARDAGGQDLIEYGILITIIAVATIALIAAIGDKVTGYFSTLDGLLP